MDKNTLAAASLSQKKDGDGVPWENKYFCATDV